MREEGYIFTTCRDETTTSYGRALKKLPPFPQSVSRAYLPFPKAGYAHRPIMLFFNINGA